jgi:hypothetical protein
MTLQEAKHTRTKIMTEWNNRVFYLIYLLRISDIICKNKDMKWKFIEFETMNRTVKITLKNKILLNVQIKLYNIIEWSSLW